MTTQTPTDFYVTVEIEPSCHTWEQVLVVIAPGVDRHGKHYAGVGRDVRRLLTKPLWEDGNGDVIFQRCTSINASVKVARETLAVLRNTASHDVVDNIQYEVELV